MSIDTSMHRCETFRVVNYHPNNGNSIRLQISGRDGDLRLNLYGLPTAITERLLHEFSDDDTCIDHDVGRKPTGESI